MHQAKVHDPAIVEGNPQLEQEVCVARGHSLVQMHVTDWAEAQKEDPMLNTVLNWLKAQKKTDLKALLAEHTSSEEGRLTLWNWHNFTIHQGALYLHAQCPKVRPKIFYSLRSPGSIVLLPSNACHRNAGHQGHVTIHCLCYRSVSGGQA